MTKGQDNENYSKEWWGWWAPQSQGNPSLGNPFWQPRWEHFKTNKQTHRQLRDDEFNIIFACVTFRIQIFQTWLQNIKTIPYFVDWWCQSNCQKCANLSILHLQTEEPFLNSLIHLLSKQFFETEFKMTPNESEHWLQSIRSSAWSWMHRYLLIQPKYEVLSYIVNAQALPKPSMESPSTGTP